MSGPRLSVVVPFENPRAELGFLDAWVRGQTADPESYEVVAVVGRRSILPPGAIGPLLRPHDQLLPHPGDRRSQLQVAGLSAARGEVLLLTEDHCRPERRCVAAVMAAFDGDPRLQAATARTTNISRTRFAALETALDETGSLVPPGDHWNRVRARGFAIRRHVLASVGGMDPEAGLFAEAKLSAALHASGVVVGRVEEAVIAHSNVFSWPMFSEEIGDYVEGEVAHCRTMDPGVDDHYFPRTSVYLRAEVVPWATARRLARAVVAIGRQEGGSGRVLAGKEAARVLLSTASLRAALVQRQVIGLGAAYLRRGASRSRAFAEVWKATARAHRLAAVRTGEAPPPAPIGRGRIEDDRLARLDGYGVHAAERDERGPFRWLAPLAAFAIQLPAGHHRVEFHTGGRRGDLATVPVGAAWNGTPLPVQILDGTVLAVDVRATGDDRLGELVLLNAPLSGVDPSERRRLALPVSAVRIE